MKRKIIFQFRQICFIDEWDFQNWIGIYTFLLKLSTCKDDLNYTGLAISRFGYFFTQEVGLKWDAFYYLLQECFMLEKMPYNRDLCDSLARENSQSKCEMIEYKTMAKKMQATTSVESYSKRILSKRAKKLRLYLFIRNEWHFFKWIEHSSRASIFA